MPNKDSIHLTVGTPYRIYLANMVEFDPINNFHMHGVMFYYWSAGTPESSRIYTDIVSLMQGDRGIVEFHYNYPGIFLFHSHLNHFSDLGWLGTFDVTNAVPTPTSTVPIATTSPSLSLLAGGPVSPQEVPSKK